MSAIQLTPAQLAEARTLRMAPEHYALAIELNVPGGPAALAAHPRFAALRAAPIVPVASPSVAHTSSAADDPLTLTPAELAVCESFAIDPQAARTALRLHLLRGGDRREFFGR